METLYTYIISNSYPKWISSWEYISGSTILCTWTQIVPLGTPIMSILNTVPLGTRNLETWTPMSNDAQCGNWLESLSYHSHHHLDDGWHTTDTIRFHSTTRSDDDSNPRDKWTLTSNGHHQIFDWRRLAQIYTIKFHSTTRSDDEPKRYTLHPSQSANYILLEMFNI